MKRQSRILKYISLLLCILFVLGALSSCDFLTSRLKGDKGEAGANGKDGADGIDGTNGITPTFKVDDGVLYVSYDEGASWKSLGDISGADGTNGKDGADGKDGTDGKDGVDGKDGKDGVSIQSVTVDEEGRLIITLSDGTILPPVELPQIEKDDEEAALLQEASEAFISYLLNNGGEDRVAECYFYEADDLRVVAFQNGKAAGVYNDKGSAKKALFDDAGTEADESQGYVIVKMTESPLSICCKDYSNLTYVAFGDSITIGVDVYSEKGIAYPQMVGQTLHFQTVNNKAVSGATFCPNSGRTNMTANILNFTGEADVISVMLGINDFWVGSPLGTPESRDNTTIYGSLHLIAEHLTQTYPNAFIFFMTPFQCRVGNTDRGAGYTLPDIVSAVKLVANEYSIPVLDMYTYGKYELEMNQSKNDGIHPSYKHHKEYTEPIVSEFLVKHCVPLQKMKVLSADLTWKQGGVDSSTGEINTTFTNNWYADIQIPEGAQQVRFFTFQTFGKWGSVFLDDNTYISGVCDSTVGQQWVTVDIPQNADVFRYGYLQDAYVEQVGKQKAQFVEFIGEDLCQKEQITQKMERPANGTHAFSVEVDISGIVGGNNPVMATDYGYIMLPQNYTPDGAPTRLIIVCHGAGAALKTYQSFEAKSHSQTYWLDMGYAIMDMYASPTALAGGSELHYGNPVVLDCYEKGYEYVMRRFNLQEDGVFVLGSSMGGLSSFQIVQSGRFPVLAQIANCPVIDLFKQAYCNPWTDVTYQRSKIAQYFSFGGTAPTFTTQKHVPTPAETDYFISNLANVLAYSPILAKVTKGDVASVFDKIPQDATSPDLEEKALYDQLTASHPCPLLIIHNKDDSTVSFRYSEYFADMVRRGGGNVVLKLYDTGGHNAWDNGPLGEIENYRGEAVQLSESRRLSIEFVRNYEN